MKSSAIVGVMSLVLGSTGGMTLASIWRHWPRLIGESSGQMKYQIRALSSAILLATVVLAAADTTAGDHRASLPREFSGVELFLDDELISSTRNIRREIQRPEKHPGNPIVRRDYPWESLHVCLYGSVMYDGERDVFRMWYNAYGQEYQKQQFLAYAESKDGISWEKPLLDFNPWPGHSRTNIVMGLQCNLHGPCVIRNPDRSDPQRRYLLLFDSYPEWRANAAQLGIQGRWCYAAESPDGLHWTPPTGRPAFAGKADSGQSVVWDPQAKMFRAYTRLTTQDAFGQRIRIWKLNESSDFIEWSEPRELLRADARDGYPDTQIQQLTVSYYDGLYIGLLSLFRIAQYDETGSGVDEGPQVNDIQLVTSRDGIHFTRVADRADFMPHAGFGEFGTFGFRTSQLVRHDNRVFIYCDGLNVPSPKKEDITGMEIGLFTMPRDRFVALTPKRMREEALVEITPAVYSKGRLLLNAAVQRSGRVEAELATFDGTTIIDGFSRANAVKISGDSLDHEIVWRKDNKTYSLEALPEALKLKPLRLRLWIRQAKIYALRNQPVAQP